MSANILLVGFYGRGNFGDDLMCQALAGHIVSTTDAHVTISAEDSTCYNDVRSDRVDIIERSIRSVLFALPKMDFLIQGGGTIFHDSYRMSRMWRYWMNLFAWVILFAIARMLGLKVLIIGSGIGPVSYFPTRVLTWAALRLATYVSVRDEPARETAMAVSGRRDISYGFDLAALGEFESSHEPEKSDEPFTIGISICDLDLYLPHGGGDHYWASLAQAVSEVARDRPTKVVFLSLFCRGSRNDDEIAQRMAEHIRNVQSISYARYGKGIADIIAPLQSCDFVIATKFHAAVAAYLTNRNLVAIGYNRKVWDFSKEIGLDPRRVQQIQRVPSNDEWLTFLKDAMENGVPPKLSVDAARTRSQTGISGAMTLIGDHGPRKHANAA